MKHEINNELLNLLTVVQACGNGVADILNVKSSGIKKAADLDFAVSPLPTLVNLLCLLPTWGGNSWPFY